VKSSCRKKSMRSFQVFSALAVIASAAKQPRGGVTEPWVASSLRSSQ
jgi:hypothetical protein